MLIVIEKNIILNNSVTRIAMYDYKPCLSKDDKVIRAHILSNMTLPSGLRDIIEVDLVNGKLIKKKK